ncbi:MAG: hypothetical protein AB7E32_09740 [Desulfovibrio sp.]
MRTGIELPALLLALCIAAPLSGCASAHRTGVEFGSSTRLALASQTLNPDAGGDAPVEGLDGEWAATAMDNYQKAPQPAREVKAMTLQSLFNVGGKK